MKKHKLFKLFLSSILSISLIFSLPHTTYAKENNTETLVIKMDYLNIHTDYLISEYYIEYLTEDGSKKAIIYEYNTGLIMDEYEEKNVTRTRDNYRNMTIQLTRSFYPTDRNIVGTKLRVTVILDIYRETIAGQRVETILAYSNQNDSDNMLSLIESGCYSLETQRVTYASHTASYCDVQYSGVIATYKASALSAGISFNFLEGVGFDMTGTTTENWIGRLPFGPKTIRITVSS